MSRLLPVRLALAASLLLASGCPDGDPVRTPIAAGQSARVTVGAIEAQRAVEAYRAQHGDNPPSLEALEAATGKLKAPPPGQAYRYDPATGVIELVEAPR